MSDPPLTLAEIAQYAHYQRNQRSRRREAARGLPSALTVTVTLPRAPIHYKISEILAWHYLSTQGFEIERRGGSGDPDLILEKDYDVEIKSISSPALHTEFTPKNLAADTVLVIDWRDWLKEQQPYAEMYHLDIDTFDEGNHKVGPRLNSATPDPFPTDPNFGSLLNRP